MVPEIHSRHCLGINSCNRSHIILCCKGGFPSEVEKLQFLLSVTKILNGRINFKFPHSKSSLKALHKKLCLSFLLISYRNSFSSLPSKVSLLLKAKDKKETQWWPCLSQGVEHQVQSLAVHALITRILLTFPHWLTSVHSFIRPSHSSIDFHRSSFSLSSAWASSNASYLVTSTWTKIPSQLLEILLFLNSKLFYPSLYSVHAFCCQIQHFFRVVFKSQIQVSVTMWKYSWSFLIFMVNLLRTI